MANQATIKAQGTTFAGSIAAGMGSIFSPGGKKYYILEHKVSTKYHKAGESQQIIIDTIELGRGSQCQVRFDEKFPTVSRRHAAIVKDGDNWKLVQLSQKNSTFLNGQPIKNEWYLQNGDEIQLSVNGPKLGFIIPTGNKSTVGSIGLTRRLSLFRQQAMRPYKTAITTLCAAIVVLAGVGTYFFIQQNDKINSSKAGIAALLQHSNTMDSLAVIQDSIYQAQLDSVARIKGQNTTVVKTIMVKADERIQKAISEVKTSIYAVKTTWYIQSLEQNKSLGQDEWTRVSDKTMTEYGTGFLLSDGRFVTARHNVQPWFYGTNILYNALATLAPQSDSLMVHADIVATSKDDVITLTDADFITNKSLDESFTTNIDGEERTCTAMIPMNNGDQTIGSDAMYGAGWAYAQVNKIGKIKANETMSSSMNSGTAVHILGYSEQMTKGGGQTEPIYSKNVVSGDGLNSGKCILVADGVVRGYSGSPVFVYTNGQLEAVAITVEKERASQQYGIFSNSISQELPQYNQFIPLSNLK